MSRRHLRPCFTNREVGRCGPRHSRSSLRRVRLRASTVGEAPVLPRPVEASAPKAPAITIFPHIVTSTSGASRGNALAKRVRTATKRLTAAGLWAELEHECCPLCRLNQSRSQSRSRPRPTRARGAKGSSIACLRSSPVLCGSPIPSGMVSHRILAERTVRGGRGGLLNDEATYVRRNQTYQSARDKRTVVRPRREGTWAPLPAKASTGERDRGTRAVARHPHRLSAMRAGRTRTWPSG